MLETVEISCGHFSYAKLERDIFLPLCDYLTSEQLHIAYLIAVLAIYDSSPLIKSLLNVLAVPVWFILLIYLSQILPVTYRLIVIFLSVILTVVGFVVDVRENIEQNLARKFNF